MQRADRQAISLSGLGLGATAVALAAQQLWPHAPWYIWFSSLSIGVLIILYSIIVLLHIHLTRVWKVRLIGVFIVSSVGGAVWYYLTQPNKAPLSLAEVYITDFAEYPSLRVNLNGTFQSGRPLRFVATKYYDNQANTYFFSIFVPQQKSTAEVCTHLGLHFNEDVVQRLNGMTWGTRAAGDLASMNDADMRFAGRVYLYVAEEPEEISPEDIGEFYRIYRINGLFLVFRGHEYLTHHFWDYERRYK